jgi:hypothetical protein
MIDYKKIKTPDNFHIRIVDETYKLVEGFVNQELCTVIIWNGWPRVNNLT